MSKNPMDITSLVIMAGQAGCFTLAGAVIGGEHATAVVAGIDTCPRFAGNPSALTCCEKVHSCCYLGLYMVFIGEVDVSG